MHSHKKEYAARNVTVVAGATAVRLIGSNPHRHRLVISPSAQGNVWYSWDPGLTPDNGMLIPSGGSERILDYETYGESITEPLFVIGTVNPTTVNATEVTEMDCGCPQRR